MLTPKSWVENFADLASWTASDWNNGEIFDCTWNPDNVKPSSGDLILEITKKATTDQKGRYWAGEI